MSTLALATAGVVGYGVGHVALRAFLRRWLAFWSRRALDTPAIAREQRHALLEADLASLEPDTPRGAHTAIESDVGKAARKISDAFRDGGMSLPEAGMILPQGVDYIVTGRYPHDRPIEITRFGDPAPRYQCPVDRDDPCSLCVDWLAEEYVAERVKYASLAPGNAEEMREAHDNLMAFARQEARRDLTR